MSELEMLLPDGLSTNAYRILRLSANASSSEIHKAAERARRASALGMPPANDVDINLLGPLAQTDADIRAAVSRLGNPAHRLKERLFWFHQVPGAELPDPSAPGAEFAVGDLVDIVRRHDEALRGLFNAFHASLDDASAVAWVRALRRWHTIVSDDSYWALSVAVENRGGFEPRALPAEVQSVRSSAVSFAAHGLLVEGRDAVNRNDATTVQRILGVLGKLAGTGSWAQIAQDELESQAVFRFTSLCGEVRETGREQIVRERFAVAANKVVTVATLDRYRQEVDPELAKLIQHFPPDHDLGRRVRESAARCLYGIAVDLTWADEFLWSEALHKEALLLAKGTPTATIIETGLEQVEESARVQRTYGKAKPITAAPSLRTINGFGVKLYGKTDFDSLSLSYTATYYIVALFLPIFPIARYRVINAGGGSYRFLGKLPLRMGDHWHQAIVAAAILVWGVMGQASSASQSSYTPPAPTYDQVASMDTSVMRGGADSDPLQGYFQRDSTAKSAAGDPLARFFDTSDTATTATGISGSSSEDLLARIDRGRVRITAFETQLNSQKADIDALNLSLEALESELRRMRSQGDADTPTGVEDYNDKVLRHNTMLARQRGLLADFNAGVDRYDELLSQDRRLLAQYRLQTKE